MKRPWMRYLLPQAVTATGIFFGLLPFYATTGAADFGGGLTDLLVDQLPRFPREWETAAARGEALREGEHAAELAAQRTDAGFQCDRVAGDLGNVSRVADHGNAADVVVALFHFTEVDAGTSLEAQVACGISELDGCSYGF